MDDSQNTATLSRDDAVPMERREPPPPAPPPSSEPERTEAALTPEKPTPPMRPTEMPAEGATRYVAEDTDALLRALRDWGCRVAVEQGEIVVSEQYLDSPDAWLYRAGALCRLRVAHGVTTAQLRSRTPLAPCGGFWGMEESAEAPKQMTLAVVAPGIWEYLQACAPGITLSPRLRLDQTWAHCRIEAGDTVVVEADIGRVVINGGCASSRIFLRTVGGEQSEAQAFRRRLDALPGLRRLEEDEFDWAAREARLDLPACGDEKTPPAPNERWADAAYRVLGRYHCLAFRNEPGARLGLAPIYLHDFRVALRRLRAAFRVFADTLPPRHVRVFREEIHRLGKAMGDVRDLDVHLTEIEPNVGRLPAARREALVPYFAHLDTQRAKARARMLALLNAKRFARLCARLRDFIAAGPPRRVRRGNGGKPAADCAAQAILAHLRKTLRNGKAVDEDAPDEALHALRIRCKRLRYVAEFFSDVHGPDAAELAESFKELQDVLGIHQDAVVAQRLIEDYADHVRGGCRRVMPLFMALGDLSGCERRRAEATRKRFFKRWRRFAEKPLPKRFRKALEAAAAAAQ